MKIITFVLLCVVSGFSLADDYYLLREHSGPSLSSLLTAAQLPFQQQQQARQQEQQRQLMEAQRQQIEVQTRYLEQLIERQKEVGYDSGLQ